MVILYAFFVIGCLLIAWSVYGFFRNEWVYKIRMQFLDDLGLETYQKLPSYNEMLDKYFWVWDKQWFVDKFAGKTK